MAGDATEARAQGQRAGVDPRAHGAYPRRMSATAFALDHLHALVDRFAGRRLLVLGDLMLDHYLWGRCERISPEAPVPVVEVQRESSSLGGAGNEIGRASCRERV